MHRIHTPSIITIRCITIGALAHAPHSEGEQCAKAIKTAQYSAAAPPTPRGMRVASRGGRIKRSLQESEGIAAGEPRDRCRRRKRHGQSRELRDTGIPVKPLTLRPPHEGDTSLASRCGVRSAMLALRRSPCSVRLATFALRCSHQRSRCSVRSAMFASRFALRRSRCNVRVAVFALRHPHLARFAPQHRRRDTRIAWNRATSPRTAMRLFRGHTKD